MKSEEQLNKMKKSELKFEVLESYDKIRALGKEIDKLTKIIAGYKKAFDKRIGIKKNAFAFIETLTSEGVRRTYNGFIIKETKYLIKINILDTKRKKIYNYIINKEWIVGIKIYNRDDSVEKYKKYKEVCEMANNRLEGWE